MLTYWIMITLGIFTGIASGLFGIGGGILLVPLLVLFFQWEQSTASGTSLSAMLLPVGCLGVFQYYRSNKINMIHIHYGLWIALGLFLGTFLGAQLATHLPELWLRKIFAVLLLCVAIKLWFFPKLS